MVLSKYFSSCVAYGKTVYNFDIKCECGPLVYIGICP